MLCNDIWVVKLLYFREWNGVFLYAPIVYFGVGKALLAQLLLPCPRKDAVEPGAKSNVKDVYCSRWFKWCVGQVSCVA